MTCWSAAVVCKNLSEVQNGIISLPKSGLIYGAIAKIACHEGYKLQGPSNRTCQSDQKWSGRDPQCLRKSLSIAIVCVLSIHTYCVIVQYVMCVFCFIEVNVP